MQAPSPALGAAPSATVIPSVLQAGSSVRLCVCLQGCGLVTMATHEEAAAALAGLHGKFSWCARDTPMVVTWMDSSLQHQRYDAFKASAKTGGQNCTGTDRNAPVDTVQRQWRYPSRVVHTGTSKGTQNVAVAVAAACACVCARPRLHQRRATHTDIAAGASAAAPHTAW